MKSIWSLCAVLSVTFSIPAFADPKGNAELGALKAQTSACVSCHGSNGLGNAPTGYPVLAGQSSTYLNKQIKDIQANKREAICKPVIVSLSANDVANITAYFNRMDRGILDDRKAAAYVEKRNTNYNTCAACHGIDGFGSPASGNVVLRGQHSTYISTQMKNFRSGIRNNDMGNMHKTFMMPFSDTDIKELSVYISRLR